MPQSAPLSAGGGGNCYLGNAQIEVASFKKGLPLHETFIFKCLSQSVPEGCVQEDGQEHHLGEQEHIK